VATHCGWKFLKERKNLSPYKGRFFAIFLLKELRIYGLSILI